MQEYMKDLSFNFMYPYQLRGMQVPSSKNSKRIITKPYPRLINNERALKYYDWCLPQLEEMKLKLHIDLQSKEKPYKFHFYFFRKDKRKWDFVNILQIVADSLQKAEIIPDDCVDWFIPIFDGYEVDKDNPGVDWYSE